MDDILLLGLFLNIGINSEFTFDRINTHSLSFGATISDVIQ